MTDHLPPPEPDHEWVNAGTISDLDIRWWCVRCGKTYTEPRETCKENPDE